MQKLIMLYAINDNTTQLVYKNQDCIENISTSEYLKKLCIDHYSTFDGRMKAIRSQFQVKRNPPLLVSTEHKYILIQVQCEINGLVWLNYEYARWFVHMGDYFVYSITHSREHHFSVKFSRFKAATARCSGLAAAIYPI